MLTKEYGNHYKISTKKAAAKPKDIEQWRKEKEKTDQKKKQPQSDEPKDKAQSK
jgi:hypothetical protein